MKKCKYCAEEIQEEAVKCKHCGADLQSEKKPKAKDHQSYGTFTLLSFLLPIVGIVLGIVYLSKNNPLDKKLGEHAIAFSLLAFVLWSIVLAMLFGGNNDPSYTPTGVKSTPAAITSNQSYQQVFTFSGTGAKNSESFTIQGSKFRIKYDCTGDYCGAFLEQVNGSVVGLIMNSGGSISDETIFYEAGEYYISTNVIGDFSFTVEDYK